MPVQGAHIPALGFGTYGMNGPHLRNVLVAALGHGFRHIDTAQMYGNEAEVGAAIRDAGVSRSEIFITTKVWVANYGAAQFAPSVDQSLRKLKTDYIDLLLVHWPRGGAPIAAQIEGLNRAVEQGKARHIGVSNYNAEMLRTAVKMSPRHLVTNQVEYHPFLDQTALLRQIAASDASLMAYCGMAVGRVFGSEILRDIAAKHERSVAQVVLRWLIQQPRVVALSRTEKIERIAGNAAVFDFALSEAEMAAITALRAPDSRIVDPGHLAPAWD
ncbi:2,5-diketo-D-gluconic acid reductase B [Terricaulis silvestris]|uniref:2,5-diketo-D-gluconic acid reductase B n=1 Tax=Terricaulis silvestris TaxID=2686094 RepID=A0A6I6MRF6_9CAUL|nr:2,5-diketo-D-gluconic acid reductase B [Terricaulis silvestris]